jgi:hypothetical protein
MATENPVFRVLVPSGNQALLNKGSRESALAVGQLGVFNYHTGLSVDETSPAVDLQDVYLALGINLTGAGGGATLEDVQRSAGQVIQTRNLKSATIKGFTDSVAKVVEFSNYAVKCETDYGFKIEFRNQAAYTLFGYQPMTKPFTGYTSACADQCVGCGDGDGMSLAIAIVDQINADVDKLVTASLYGNAITATVAAGPTASGTAVITVGTTAYNVALTNGDSVTVTAQKIRDAINNTADSPYYATNAAGVLTIYAKKTVNGATDTLVVTSGLTSLSITPIVAATKTNISTPTTFKTTYPGVSPGIRFTANETTLKALGGTNMHYLSSNETDIIVTPLGFENNGTVETITKLQYSDGSGYYLKYLENHAKGWGPGGVYRLSDTLGMERAGFPDSRVSLSANYNVAVFSYDQMSVGGWMEYLNNLETIIAIPCADSTTLTDLFAILDVVFAGKMVMTNDVASMDCTNTTVNTLTAATDGISSLA